MLDITLINEDNKEVIGSMTTKYLPFIGMNLNTYSSVLYGTVEVKVKSVTGYDYFGVQVEVEIISVTK